MSARPVVIAAVIAVAGSAAAFAYLYFGKSTETSTQPAQRGTGGGGAIDDTITNDEERVAYVEKSIVISDLVIGPDAKPGEDAGMVAGLLRVSGTVSNHGDRAVKTVILVINPQDAKDEVIGSYVQDLLHEKRLGPGESRPFKFQIPSKKEFSGRFLHKLR